MEDVKRTEHQLAALKEQYDEVNAEHQKAIKHLTRVLDPFIPEAFREHKVS